MAEQFKVAVPYEKRIPGLIYDADSGVCMGLASDEMKKKYKAGEIFDQNISGCPHKLLIHAAPIKPTVVEVPAELDLSKIYHWTYTRSHGDIDVFAPNKTEALRLISETGLVKTIDVKRLKKCLDDNLAAHLKKEEIRS